MDHQTGRLVNNDQRLVLIQDGQGDRFRCRAIGARCQLGLQRDFIPCDHAIARLDDLAVDANLAAANPARQQAARKVRPAGRQKLIKALPRLFG